MVLNSDNRSVEQAFWKVSIQCLFSIHASNESHFFNSKQFQEQQAHYWFPLLLVSYSPGVKIDERASRRRIPTSALASGHPECSKNKLSQNIRKHTPHNPTSRHPIQGYSSGQRRTIADMKLWVALYSMVHLYRDRRRDVAQEMEGK